MGMNDQYTYLHSIKPILPKKVFPQETLVDWVVEAHEQCATLLGESCDKRRLRKFALNNSYISQRYMECPDESTDWENHHIYRIVPNSPRGIEIHSRNKFFSGRALEIMKECYQNRELPDHLIHVTCTGYIAPSAPQLYFATLPNSPAVTHAYHMGCYASLPSVRMGSAIAKAENKKVDVLHNEMCSIHMNPSVHHPEQIVVETLFADGHISYQISSEKKGFRILGVKEKLIPETSENMSWIPGAYGMSMTLTRDVPIKIRDNILPFVMEMADEFEVDLPKLIKNGVFAIHPGGPRIIDVVKTKLELREEQVKESSKILYERGNMSSATLPHIWHEIEKNNYPSGTLILSLAFGPGLTVFGSIFEVI